MRASNGDPVCHGEIGHCCKVVMSGLTAHAPRQVIRAARSAMDDMRKRRIAGHDGSLPFMADLELRNVGTS